MPTLEAMLPRIAIGLPTPMRWFDPAPDNWTGTRLWLAVQTAGARSPAQPLDAAPVAALALADLTDAEASGLLPEAAAATARVCVVLHTVSDHISRGDFDGARAWLVVGLGGTDETLSTITTTGIVTLLADAEAGDVTAEDALALLGAALFHLNQHAGYLAEIVNPLADSVAAALLHMAPSAAACWGVAAALTWAAGRNREDLGRALAQWCLEAIPRLPDPEQRARLLLAVALTQTGPRRQAALRLLGDGQFTRLPAELRLQAFIAGIERTTELTSADTRLALSLIDEHWRTVAGGLDAEALARLRERTFTTIAPLLTALLRRRATDDLIRVLRHWIGVPDETIPVGHLLLAHRDDGVHYAWPGGAHHVPAPENPSAVDDAVNAALGTALASSADPTRQVHTAATGRPDRPAGPALEQVSEEALGLNHDQPPAVRPLDETTLLVPVPGHRLPYQALIAKHLGKAPLLWTSLRAPSDERWPDRVALLEGDSDLSGVEITLVSGILTRGGIEVIRHHPSNGRDLDAVFANPDYDVIWLSGHGRQPPYHPDQAAIDLRPGVQLRAADLRVLPATSAQRRLLVLNSCDGAATATAGGLRSRGLAAEAAGPLQSVVGHQWVVAERLAATFGALLACALVEQRNQACAFTETLRWLRRPWRDVAGLLADFDCAPEAVAHLAPPTGGYGHNILDWGAPAFYC